MKILFLTDNFYPEVNAPSKRTLEHSKQWINLGHDVTVITGVPNFPKGKVFDGYKNKIYQSEIIEKIEVKRVWTFISANKGFLLRIIDYLSYMFSSMICGMAIKKHDVVIATSPQFFSLISGYIISVIKRTPLVIELRDLWPESIVTVGVLRKDSIIIFLLQKISLFVYKKSKLIICVTNSFKKDLVKMGVNKDKIKVVENGFDLSKTVKTTKNISELEEKFNLKKENFIISFIGTIGMAHGLRIILKAAKKLDDVIFLIVGEGAEKSDLILKAKENKVNNVIFVDNLGWQDIVDINQLIDCHLIHLIRNPEFEKVIPSKIFESMALSKPIIMGVEGEARQITNSAECSINITPESHEELIQVVNQIKYDNETLNEMGTNGNKFLKKNYCRKSMANKMIEFIQARI